MVFREMSSLAVIRVLNSTMRYGGVEIRVLYVSEPVRYSIDFEDLFDMQLHD